VSAGATSPCCCPGLLPVRWVCPLNLPGGVRQATSFVWPLVSITSAGYLTLGALPFAASGCDRGLMATAAVHGMFLYSARMNDREAYGLIADLERSDGAESTYRPTVETSVADLMERTFNSTDQDEEVRLDLKCWKGRNVN
jgi:hypothetical protein